MKFIYDLRFWIDDWALRTGLIVNRKSKIVNLSGAKRGSD